MTTAGAWTANCTKQIVQEILDRRSQLAASGIPDHEAIRIAESVVMTKLHRQFEANYYCKQDVAVECDETKVGE